jgi:hypothetical protein
MKKKFYETLFFEYLHNALIIYILHKIFSIKIIKQSRKTD